MKESSEKEKNYVHMKIHDQAGGIWTFKLKNTTKLGKVFADYLKRTGVSPTSKLRFIYEGRTLSAEDTPESVSMSDKAEVEVFSPQTGG